MEEFGNGGKKCAHIFGVPITFDHKVSLIFFLRSQFKKKDVKMPSGTEKIGNSW